MDNMTFNMQRSNPDEIIIHTMYTENSETDILANISDETLRTFKTVVLVFILTGLSCFGICANVINIIVFIKQGFGDSINVTLFAMAQSDLAYVMFAMWRGVCNNEAFMAANTNIIHHHLQTITAGWPLFLFSRVTGWLMAFLTVERCLCVIFPLKVKAIMTPTRTKVAVTIIYVFTIAGAAPVFFATPIGWHYVPSVNRTMLSINYHKDMRLLLTISYTVIGIGSTIVYSFLVLASTIILSVSLMRQTRWRQKSASQSDEKMKAMGSKELAVIRLVVSIAVLFIICLLVPSSNFIPKIVAPEYSSRGKYRNFAKIISSIAELLSATNASVSIFFYYTMSSNYKSTFQQVFLGRKKK